MSGPIAADRPHMVLARCPNCEEAEMIRVALVTRLDKTRAAATLGLKVKVESVPHVCGQVTIDEAAQ